jgi:nitrate/nitrite transporter NarK
LYPVFVVLGLIIGCGTATVNCGLIQCWWFPERNQGTVNGVLLFSTSCGPAVLGAIAEPIIRAAGLAGFFLFWSLCLLLCAIVALIFGFDPPYLQLIRLANRAHYEVEELPANFDAIGDAMAKSNDLMISQDEVKSVAHRVYGQDIFPTRALLVDLRMSVSSIRSWCVILVADITLGCYLGYIVWVPVYMVSVFQVSPYTAGLILMGYGLAGAIGSALAGPIIDHTNVWIGAIAFLALSLGSFICVAAAPQFGLVVAAIMLLGVSVLAANTACYKLVITECPESAAGCICFMECGADLIAFALPLIFAKIYESVGNANGLRIGLSIPCALLAVSFIPLWILHHLHVAPNQKLQRYKSGLLDTTSV